MNWVEIYNRLFEIINEQGPNYFKGPRFIEVVRQFNPYFPSYTQYIDQRNQEKKSTSRKDYYRGIFFSFDDMKRINFVKMILRETQAHNQKKTAELRSILDGQTISPTADIPQHVWSADRLNHYLEDIDASITTGDHARAITLSYTCLEGFFKAFIEANIPDKKQMNELVSMSREIQKHLRDTIPAYPDEALKLLNHIAHTIDKTRNAFSKSHFGSEAEKWLSTFIRDCVNSTIRLLLSFM